MMLNYLILLLALISSLYSQCSSYGLVDCDNNVNCEWIEDVSYASCSSLGTGNSSFCDAQPNCSYSWLTYSCSGGTYQIDNSYCQEVEIIECSEMNQVECLNNSCNWVEDIQIENCYGIAWNENDCESIQGCSWWTSNYYGTSNCTGSYQIDNSYCEDILVNNCSDMNESNCNSSLYCDWVEDYYWDNCSNYSSSSSCYAANNIGGNCDWYWNSTLWQDTCSGGSFQVDISYCEDIQYLLGDATGDLSVNVLDVIQIVSFILNNEYSIIVDMNYDNQLNVLDVILVVDIILGN